jgi:hypothetical protein
MIGIAQLERWKDGQFPHNTRRWTSSPACWVPRRWCLPGVSGSYMLLVIGQYDHVLAAVDDRNLRVIAPVGIGAVVGIIGLSNILKFLLHRYHQPTVGLLLGILLGSVVGLWPFGKAPGSKALERRDFAELARFVEDWQVPGVADTLAGTDTELLAEADREAFKEEVAESIVKNWPGRGRPGYSTDQVTRAAICIVVGFVVTFLLARSGRPSEKRPANPTD